MVNFAKRLMLFVVDTTKNRLAETYEVSGKMTELVGGGYATNRATLSSIIGSWTSKILRQDFAKKPRLFKRV